MKSYTSLWMAIFATVVFAQSSAAFIDPDAPSASHHMEGLAAEIHDHLHHNYGDNSFGAHGLEVAAGELHDTLHDWDHGEATESEVAESMDALAVAWRMFNQMIHHGHVLNSDDEALDVLFDMNKHAYKELRFLLRKAK